MENVEVKNTTNDAKKMSYEELEATAKELFTTCSNLQNQLKELNMFNAFKRLEYLFKVVEHVELFGDFGKKCVEEVKEIMTLPVEDENPKGV